MKARFVLVSCLVAIFVLSLSLSAAPVQEKAEKPHKPKSEKFGALAYLPHGAGPAMVGAGARVNVDLYLDSYTSDADAKMMAAALLEGGSEGLLKQLEDAKSIGKVRLVGRAGFYDFKLIRSHQVEGGRRIYAVGDRPMGFLEVYAGGRSTDYPFGIMQLDLKRNAKGKEEGKGALIYAARIKVLENNRIEVESYGPGAIELMAVRKL
jgi:hypothetical protein